MLSVSSPSPSPFLKAPINSHRTIRFRPPSVVTNSATASEKRQNLYQGMASCMSLYEILGIPAAATREEIKTAYRRLARTFHPDVAAMDRKASSANEFKKIHAAYSTLSDPEKRAVYDRKFMIGRVRPLTMGYSGYTGRTWETDQCW